MNTFKIPYFPANKPTRQISRGQFLPLKMRVFPYYCLISRIRKSENIDLCRKHQYPLKMIGNMDKTPVLFDMVGNKTVNQAGEKTIWVKTTGHEKQQFTVVLACLADGTKLPPMVIFKRHFQKKNFLKGVIVHVQENRWMDDKGCIKWINKVCERCPGGLLNCKSLLVWDMFKSHLCENIKTTIKRINTDIAVIPSGLTSILQPLDVCLNKPFKDGLRKCWNEWMVSGDHTFTAAGNMCAASLTNVCEWVVKSWDNISIESVQKSFKKCGISNAMDGTEDDLLWLDDEEEDSNVSTELPVITAENDPYDDQVSGQEWNLLFNDSKDEDEFNGF